MLKQDPNVDRRQVGIFAFPNGCTITSQNHMVGFNGANNSTLSLYFGGQVGDIYYQVQGNTRGCRLVATPALPGCAPALPL